ncbi:MAG TPA: carbamoyl phosphate synthase large subunit, partial [Candidatus Dormibacteraeota bacterium]|nr:carbamoyl phosphate synthase large subunit [Candidatus Dormibacteraeota bacterium]
APVPPLVAVKAPVFSMRKLDSVDALLGPEMKSTGEVMGVAATLADALEKACVASFGQLPDGGGALISIADADKAELLPVAASLAELGFTLYATAGTATALLGAGVSAERVAKLHGGSPSVVDVIRDQRVELVINTISRTVTDETSGDDEAAARRPVRDGYRIRQAAVQAGIPCLTSIDTAAALVAALARRAEGEPVRVATVGEYRQPGGPVPALAAAALLGAGATGGSRPVP